MTTQANMYLSFPFIVSVLCEWDIFSRYFAFYLCHLNFLKDIIIFGRQICILVFSELRSIPFMDTS